MSLNTDFVEELSDLDLSYMYRTYRRLWDNPAELGKMGKGEQDIAWGIIWEYENARKERDPEARLL